MLEIIEYYEFELNSIDITATYQLEMLLGLEVGGSGLKPGGLSGQTCPPLQVRTGGYADPDTWALLLLLLCV